MGVQKKLMQQNNFLFLVLFFLSSIFVSSCNMDNQTTLPEGTTETAIPSTTSTTIESSATPATLLTTTTTTVIESTAGKIALNSFSKTGSLIENLLSLRAICQEKAFKWSSIEVIETLEKGTLECMVTADERLSSFTPLILYVNGPIELRRVKNGRELFFSTRTSSIKVKPASPIEAARIFQEIRKELKKQIPEAQSKLVTSTGESGSSALRISSVLPMELLAFIKTLDTHIYSIIIDRNENGEESITTELEAVISEQEQSRPKPEQ
jgi:hypothetical protein